MDTDTAGDDVTSMLFALRWPEVSLEAVSVVAGNVYLDEAIANALVTVEKAGRPEVPVFRGAAKPLVRDLVTAHYVHGDDGMGGAHFPKAGGEVAPLYAANAIVETANRFAGELQIIAQAPLTNLAFALLEDPELPRKVERLWIMGGANNSLGNITPAAEFNFYVDPEAAHVVLQAGFNVTLVPWDVCLLDGVLLREELGPILDMGTELSEFYLQANKGAWEFMATHPHGPRIDGISHPDALTTAMAIDPKVITASGRFYVDVEHGGELTRGYSLVDISGATGLDPNCEVVLRADKARITEMLLQVLSG